MKKMFFLLLFTVVLQSTIKADNDKPISFEQLPTQSRNMINTHFPKQSIALVKMEDDFFDKSYEVIFTNGSKVEFDKNGAWKEVDCKYTELPMNIVPKQIRDYVTKNYTDAKIVKIEKDRRNRTEIKLSNGIDLEFDANYNLIDIDY